jgi:uncharacterized protein (TIGR00369 family)
LRCANVERVERTLNEEHHRKLERMYVAAPINRAIYRPQITVGDATCEITCEARPDLHHGAGALHGSVYFKMLDDAAFFAIQSAVTDVFVLTASFNVSLLRPITVGTIRAVGRVVRASSAISVAEATLFDPDGKEAARGIGDFARSRIALEAKLGYV